MNEENLTPKDYLGLAIEAGIGAIPVIGGPVQTLYFGRQNEKRFKRIEKFYESLNEDLSKTSSKIEEIENTHINRDQLMGILETINEEVEKARSQSKIDLFKNLYKNSLLKINNTTWDEEEYFVEILSRLTPLQINLIVFFIPNREFKGEITANGYDQEFVDGSLNILTDYGLLESTIASIELGEIGKQKMGYRLSSLGRKFVTQTLSWILVEINKKQKENN